MLRGSTLDEADQIIGEAAVCSGWTRMEGQGSWNVQQFRVKYRLVYLYVLRCYVKYKDLFLGQGLDSYSTSILARFKIGLGNIS